MSKSSGARLDAPVHLVRGGDEVIVRAAVRELVHALVGERDPSPGAHTPPTGSDLPLGPLRLQFRTTTDRLAVTITPTP